jgi:hypothetical protein
MPTIDASIERGDSSDAVPVEVAAERLLPSGAHLPLAEVSRPTSIWADFLEHYLAADFGWWGDSR